MIEGVTVIPLHQIPDERGMVMHMLRADDPHFEVFGEIYFSVVELGAIKAWHLHERMTINYAVPYGKIKLVVFDDRDRFAYAWPSGRNLCGRGQLLACAVPPFRLNGSRDRVSTVRSWRTAPSIPHDPDEIVRLDPFSDQIPYDWSLKHG